MGRIVSSYIFPHTPGIIPGVGGGSESAALQTLKAIEAAVDKIKEDSPTTIIITTPHGPVFQDFVYISDLERLEGDLSSIGIAHGNMVFHNNLELVEGIIGYAYRWGIYSGSIDENTASKHKLSKKLDHGSMVPLYFIGKKLNDFNLVHISIAGLPFLDLYRFGSCIAKAVEDSDERVVLVASGNLSYKLSENSPQGFSKQGKEYDEQVVDIIKEVDVERLFDIDEDFCHSAGECGLRSFLMMFGALDGYEVENKLFSYESPFGVGNMVAGFTIGHENPERKIVEKIEERNARMIEEIRSNEDPYVALARNTLETYVMEGSILPMPDVLPAEMTDKAAGTFVSIKKHGQLRGCIGTTAPTRRNIAEEIMSNAISSGTRDPRFDPVEPDELDSLVYSVDVLNEPEPIKSMDELDVIRYGVIVRAGRRSGLLLPNLDGVDTPQQQVSIALQKAGIRPDENYTMERFEVIRHK